MPHKLLLADDSITIQRVIELTFADEDVHVRAVGDGKSAIASIQSERPDIVLADVGMPERDGYEVAEFIKGNPQLASIPVLLLTGAFEPIDESRARAVGCDGVLVKPFEPQMVINRVKDLLAGRRSGGGLWGNKAKPSPSQESTPAAPTNDANPQPAVPGEAAATSASLEDYFDRLDAAFASVEAATEAHGVARAATRAPGVVPPADVGAGSSSGLAKHDLEGWDPDLTGDPINPAAAPTRPLVPAGVQPPPAAAAAQPGPARPAVSSAPAAPIPFKPTAQAPADTARSAPEAAAPPSPASPVAIPFAAPAAVAAPAPVAPPVEPRPPASAPAPVAEPEEPKAPTVAPSPAMVAAPTPVPPIALGRTPLPSLADAFAALLSAEQGRSISPSKVGAPNVSDQAIDDIVNRVIARMTDQSVRDSVIQVAERLVREEIERIKLGQ
jgi:CheY-like chemotaxis protein